MSIGEHEFFFKVQN